MNMAFFLAHSSPPTQQVAFASRACDARGQRQHELTVMHQVFRAAVRA
jgi:hypothetical protein